MIHVHSPREMHRWVAANSEGTRGLVPTMGALHEGHETLLQRAREENDRVVLSIFVNPTQFNVQTDFDKYPRTLDRDLRIAEHHGVDAVYLPTVEAMYPPGFASFVEPGTASEPMEGEGRPGHFRGVTTVVAKLFHAVSPHRAYFGKKDYQQLAVIRQMVAELDFAVHLVGVDTVRETDGLAMSSRNVRLSSDARRDASVIHEALQAARVARASGQINPRELVAVFEGVLSRSTLVRLEYARVVDSETLAPVQDCSRPTVMCVAAWYDDVRLIDNVELDG